MGAVMYHFVIPGALVRFLDVVVGLVVRPEIFDVHFRIRIADRLVREETELLVRADRPAYLLVDVGLDQLRAPVAVIALDEDCIGDIVQKAGENRFFRHGRLQSMGRALQHMVDALRAYCSWQCAFIRRSTPNWRIDVSSIHLGEH
jgi:hypothetical protein